MADKLKHEDVCTLLRNKEDRDILTRKLFDVNMRLYKTSLGYREIVMSVAAYICNLAMTKREGYKKPHGFSGANAGIPFNIIAVADGTIILNPKIVDRSKETRISESNCGSLLLDKPIKIRRYANVHVTGFNIHGDPVSYRGYLPTMQHEIDHNNGTLITHRKVVEQKNDDWDGGTYFDNFVDGKGW